MPFLDRTARRYGVRPSQLVGETDEWAALYIDLATTDHGKAQGAADAVQAGAFPVFDISR